MPLSNQVRIKPKQSKVEFELAMDVNSENYDGEVDEHIKLRKQVRLDSLSSPLVTVYI